MDSSIQFSVTIFIIALLFILVSAVLQGISGYKMAKKLEYKNPWLAAFPIVFYIFYCDIAQISRGYAVLILLGSLIPFVGSFIALGTIIMLSYKTFKRFNVNEVLYLIIWCFVPFGMIGIQFKIALDDKIEYNPT